MKKYLFSMLAIAALIFAACTSKGPADEAIDLINDATEKVEQAENLNDMQTFSEEFETKFNELEKKYPDFKPNADEEKRIGEAQKKFEEVCEKKAEEFLSDILGTEGEEEESEE